MIRLSAAATRWLGTPLVALALGAAAADRAPGQPNRLIDSGSLYLMQHAHNPVDWHPWGEEAFAKARREGKPIFLSIGYSTCYWCHVAERTLFSVPEIAALMNAGFVNVKVDREQHPDVDQTYLIATQLLTGQVGWPNNLFLTPDLKPFFAGSYFPPEDDHNGRPGFPTVLRAIRHEWSGNRARLESVADRVAAAMAQANARAAAPASLDTAALAAEARSRLVRSFDPEHGGFTLRSPVSRFPMAPSLLLLADDGVAPGTPLARTLDAMLLGALFDHLGGGFHRYTVDSGWSVPHFEKMLYDNAQLLALYARAHRASGVARYRDAAQRTAAYLLGRMQDPGGGFQTAEDAQVDGREGASYVWSAAEVERVLGPADAARFLRIYAITPLPEQEDEALLAGGERGALRIRAGADAAALWQAAEDLAPLRVRLLAARDRRPQPARDDKLIVSLNALAIAALAEAGTELGEPAWVSAAVRAAERIWRDAWDDARGELRHEIFRGRAQRPGYLDDYALLGDAYLTLAQATSDARWRERAARLADAMLAAFARPDGGLNVTRAGNALPVAPEDQGDNAQPSGSSAALALLIRLPAPRHRDAAARLAAHLAGELAAYPEEWPSALRALAAPQAQPVVAAAVARLTSTATEAGADTPADSARHVRARGAWIEREGTRELVVTVEVAPGYHVNANPASYGYLIPTALELAEAAGVEYPRPARIAPDFAREGIDVYAGRFEIRARLRPGAAAAGATLRVQACTDEVCLLPARVPVTFGPEG
ncbi:MAG: thioredoxin domain-containing protein [Pseudomonadota bacterium]